MSNPVCLTHGKDFMRQSVCEACEEEYRRQCEEEQRQQEEREIEDREMEEHFRRHPHG